jgi:hypothetical protein
VVLNIEQYLFIVKASALFCLIILLSGCATKHPDDIRLIERGAGVSTLNINRARWEGFLGPDGNPGYVYWTYYATLDGDGPIYVNPPFQDMPSDFKCIGTITLDREHKLVTVNMRRIISAPGQPVRTRSHPANGTYKINFIGKYFDQPL